MKRAISFLILATVLLFYPAFSNATQFLLTVDPNVTRNQAVVSKIRDDIATQFTIFDSYFGTKLLTFEVIVYPTYKSIKHPILGIGNTSRINLVLPNFFYKSTGKTRTIYKDMLDNIYPYSSPATRQAIAQFLSNEFYGVDSTQLASLSRYSFHDMPIPDSIDSKTQNHSIYDKLSAKFKKIAISEGNALLGFFLEKALNDGLSYAIQEKYKQDFKSFIRSTPLVPIPKTFDKDLFKSIYNSQAQLWRKLPQKPIPLDTAWRNDSQAKLELAKILIMQDSKDQIQTMISEVNQTLNARDAESFSWWFISAFLFLIVVFCFTLTLKLSSSYGTIRNSHSKANNPEPPTINISPEKPKTYLISDQSPIEKSKKPRFRGRPATRIDAENKQKNSKGKYNK
jgi:hypothetical protein